MKRIAFAIILWIVVSSLLKAQVKPYRFGVKVSPNLAWMTPDSENYEQEGIAAGFSWGFISDITLSDNYFIKTGFDIDYLNCGLSYPDTRTLPGDTSGMVNGRTNRLYHLRYLELPATLKMRTNNFGKTTFFGDIGFGASFNLRAKSEDEFFPANGGAKTETESDIMDEISLVRASLIVGAGMEYFIDNSTSLIVELLFNNGLSNVLTGNNPVETETKQRAQLYYLELTIGVLF